MRPLSWQPKAPVAAPRSAPINFPAAIRRRVNFFRLLANAAPAPRRRRLEGSSALGSRPPASSSRPSPRGRCAAVGFAQRRLAVAQNGSRLAAHAHCAPPPQRLGGKRPGSVAPIPTSSALGTHLCCSSVRAPHPARRRRARLSPLLWRARTRPSRRRAPARRLGTGTCVCHAAAGCRRPSSQVSCAR